MSTRATPPRCRGVAPADRCHLSLITASTAAARRKASPSRSALIGGDLPHTVRRSPMRLCDDRTGSFARIPCLRRPRPRATSARTCRPLCARPPSGAARARPCAAPLHPARRAKARSRGDGCRGVAAGAMKRTRIDRHALHPCSAKADLRIGMRAALTAASADRPPRICGRWRQGRRTHRPARRQIGDRRPGSARAHASSRCLIRHSSRDWERHAEEPK